jgi:protein-disulfide isomerase
VQTLADADNTEQLIERKVEQKWQEYLESEAFESRVEAVILQFIEKQQQARVEQQRTARGTLMNNIAPIDPATDRIRGAEDAAFTLIEYSDFECPFCKRFHSTAREFIERNSEVNWVYRHFPLDFHNPGAQKQAEAAECAGELGGNEQFWRYTDRIYERTRSNGKGFPVENLVPLAVEIGLDENAFESCFDSERYRDKVLQQFANGQASGVSGTPGSFLRHNASDETVPISGAQPLAVLEQVLQQLRQAVE